jgi:hypothetical protein
MQLDTIIVLLTCAAQLGALIRFMMKWEGRLVAMDTILQIIAAKNGVPYAGAGKT